MRDKDVFSSAWRSLPCGKRWLIIFVQIGYGCHYFWSHDCIHPTCFSPFFILAPQWSYRRLGNSSEIPPEVKHLLRRHKQFSGARSWRVRGFKKQIYCMLVRIFTKWMDWKMTHMTKKEGAGLTFEFGLQKQKRFCSGSAFKQFTSKNPNSGVLINYSVYRLQKPLLFPWSFTLIYSQILIKHPLIVQ